VGEGMVSNLSFSGCQVFSERTVLAGSYIKMSVVMSNPAQSLFIELGKIRWVGKGSFGVEFIRLPTIARCRLDRILWENALIEAHLNDRSLNS
jgi:hypothetical protein